MRFVKVDGRLFMKPLSEVRGFLVSMLAMSKELDEFTFEQLLEHVPKYRIRPGDVRAADHAIWYSTEIGAIETDDGNVYMFREYAQYMLSALLGVGSFSTATYYNDAALYACIKGENK